MRKVSQILVLLFSCVFFYGCSVAKPSNIKNICAIFDEQEDWYDYANNAYQRVEYAQNDNAQTRK